MPNGPIMTALFQLLFDSGCSIAALIPLHPPAASSIANDVDRLHYTLTAITLFFTVLIFTVIFLFMIKYRRRSEDERAEQITMNIPLEITWTVIPLLICAGLFVWASALYVRNSRPPVASTEIFVIGKQWMWHLQHPEGPREIDELHVPVNVPIKLTMTSQDVIHGFFIPAFRIKKDVVPGLYTQIWFKATQVGDYHLFCTQYCGASHSRMIGWIHVMEPTAYAAWLASNEKNESMAQEGERLFDDLGCVSCHAPNNTGLGPSLVGMYGKPEKLRDGSTRMADEALIRQAIVNPDSVPLLNYPPVMPTFKGQVDEAQVLQLVAYIKSLGAQERTPNP
jgi:cytochrome c oxidase subunit II